MDENYVERAATGNPGGLDIGFVHNGQRLRLYEHTRPSQAGEYPYD